MHGLIGERFLKWFAGNLRHRPGFSLMPETGSEANPDEETSSNSDSPEDKEMPGKEVSEHSEKADEMTQQFHRQGEVDQVTEVTQSLDSIQKTE